MSESGPTIPATAHWRLDCVTSDKTLVGWTAASVQSQSNAFGLIESWITIEIPGSVNAIQDESNKREEKQVLIVADRDTDREYSEVVPYYVRQVRGRT